MDHDPPGPGPERAEAIMSLIRRIYPDAPAVGAKVWIFLGRTAEGRNTIICGPEDRPFRATVLAYRIELGETNRGWPLYPESAEVLARVKVLSGLGRLDEKEDQLEVRQQYDGRYTRADCTWAGATCIRGVRDPWRSKYGDPADAPKEASHAPTA